MDTNAKVGKTVSVRITTSGYSDRFLMFETNYCVRFLSNDANHLECHFDDDMKAIDFLVHGLGYSFDGAWNLAHRDCASNMYISGGVTVRRSMGLQLSSDDIASINAYLKTREEETGYTPRAVAEFQTQLEKHPLSNDLLAIVEYQIAICDRRNIETWGHKNGYQAALAAGLLVPPDDMSAADAVRRWL